MNEIIVIKGSTDLSLNAKESLLESKAKNTRKSYSVIATNFAKFLGVNIEDLPQVANAINENVIINYLDSLNGKNGKAKPNTIKLNKSALVELFKLLGVKDNPAKGPTVALYLQGMQRVATENGVKTRQAKALTIYDIYRIVDCLGNTERDALYKALILVGFSGLFRRSELLGMRVENITKHENGFIAYLQGTKTSKGKGVNVNIPDVNGEYSPAKALAVWLDVLANRGVKSGFVFQTFNHKAKSGMPMNAEVFNRTLRKCAKKAGITDWTGISGHSLRRGGATTLIKAGINSNSIVKKGRWKDSRMLNTYYETDIILDDPMYKVLG